MHDHYDRLENRTAAARETALFRDLRHVLNVAKARVPSLRQQLKGFDLGALQGRADMAAIPVLRDQDLIAMQTETPPFGGLAATRLPLLRQVFVTVSSMVALEGQAKDWWGCGRALYAAGLRKGTLVLNCFPYDLSPYGHMIASGAAAIGAPIVPAGAASLQAKAAVVARLMPQFFCGPAGHLKELLDFGEERGLDMTSLKMALVTGHMGAGRRSEYALRKLAVRQSIMLPELGVVAFESEGAEGLVVNEGLIVEIVDPVTSRPVPVGAEGEIVVSRINADYPLLRYGTGLFSAILPPRPTCGHTNIRLRAPGPAAGEIASSDGIRITATHLHEIRKVHPCLGRMRLFMRRSNILHLTAEQLNGSEVIERVSETLHLVTRMRGTVEFVAPGSISDDDAPIVDERALN